MTIVMLHILPLKVISLGMYKGKTSYDGISTVDEFLTSGTQALQHWWKECVDLNGNYVKK